MAFLGFHIDDAFAEKFAAMAASECGKSALMRRLVERAVGDGRAPARAMIATSASRKVTIRLKERRAASSGDHFRAARHEPHAMDRVFGAGAARFSGAADA